MPKMDASFSLEDYAPVADRITLFYSKFPTGRIVTELISQTETQVVFKAAVFRSPDEREPAASGWASERFGDGEINSVACLENTETSAVGRALANLGLTASRNRPSLEEMEKAARARVLAARTNASISATGNEVSRPLRRVKEPPAIAYEALQNAADHVSDVLHLVEEAQRLGLSESRVTELRTKLTSTTLRSESVDRVERALRRWLVLHHGESGPARDERPLSKASEPPVLTSPCNASVLLGCESSRSLTATRFGASAIPCAVRDHRRMFHTSPPTGSWWRACEEETTRHSRSSFDASIRRWWMRPAD
jgi:hypothetical protein